VPWLALSLSRLSHTVRRLETRGWVRRAPLPSDGRLTIATLTESGYAKIVASAPDHVRLVRSLVVDALSERQLKQLAAITRQLNDQLALSAAPDGTGFPCSPQDTTE
jgi:DNA-binding MarR family transcriptional regulator